MRLPNYDFKRKYIILKLPCGHGNVQVTDKKQSQYITCPKCFKHFVLIWEELEKMKIMESKK